ncbi:MAG: ribonuclease P protein component [Christensenellales bacterium]
MTSQRLKRNKEFQYVYRRGKSASDKYLVLIHIKAGELRSGFSVGKRIGNSVIRNHTKRLMREAFRSITDHLRPAKIVFVAREGILGATYWDIRKSMVSLLHRAGLMVQTNE